MTDQMYTDPEWERFNRELGLWLRLARWLEENRRRVVRERTQIVNQGDVFNVTPAFTAVTLAGIRFGSNTTEAGVLFVRTAINGANRDVRLFRATGGGGGDEVAQAIAAPLSTTSPWVAVNSSGISGTVSLGATVAADVTDRHTLLILEDWKLEELDIFPSDGVNDTTPGEDSFSRAALSRTLTDLGTTLASAITRVQQGLTEWALTASDNLLARGNRHLNRSDSALITDTFTIDASGNRTSLRTGFFESLRADWEDETTGSEQDAIQRVVAAGVGIFSSNNDGQGTLAAHTPEDHAPIGTWRFRCVQGVGNNRGGTEEFAGEFTAADDDQTFGITGLRIKRSWKGEQGFGPVTLLRTLLKTGDGGDVTLGAVGTFTIAGESEAHTSGGIRFWRILL